MRRYLLVDDNLAFAENVAEILRDAGSEPVFAESPADAVQLARRQRFDALVTDMRMPALSGAKLVHEIRAQDPGLPIIVVSAYTDEGDLSSAREEGLLAVLPKPVPVPRLLQLLALARRDGLVALVEDDAALADSLSEALRDRGFSVVTARSVAETDELGLRALRPFVGLVDLRVAGGPDGAALRTLLERFPRLPVLAMSAHAGASGFPAATTVFAKPFDTGRLLGAIEAIHGSRG